jgi:hypothetical protein
MSTAGEPPSGEVLDPAFKLVLLIVSIGTFSLLLVMIVLAATDASNDASKNLFETSSTMFKVGFGAIVGLLGGKAL